MFSFKKKIAICAAVMASVFSVQAQQAVKFEEISFDEALSRAAKTGKIIFVDVAGMNPNQYNQKVEQEIFTQDSVASFFNTNSINVKMNMSSEEGKKFAPRLAMLMYPVYVFFDGKGTQLDFINAAAILKDPSAFMGKARAALKQAQMRLTNTRSINFSTDKWADLLARAKKENKLIFFDASTEWCRPCIMMMKNVFTLNNVADFYNSNFINVTMDMEKGEGPAIGKKYEVKAYPTFLYIDGDGKQVYRSGGYQEADSIIKEGKEALKQKKK